MKNVSFLWAAVIAVGMWLLPVSVFFKIFLMFLITLVLVIVAGIHKIPTIHFGMVTFLGARTFDFRNFKLFGLKFKYRGPGHKFLFRKQPRILKEGWRFIVPFFEDVDLFTIELVTTEIEPFTVTSQDKLDITITGSVQWQPDATEKGLCRFIEVNEDTITKGLRDAVKARLGEISGISIAEDFFEHREILALFINSYLRQKNPCDRDSFDKMKDNGDLAARDSERKEVKKRLKASDKSRDMSQLEERYGINVRFFALADVNFTVEMKKAFEAERQEGQRMLGATEILDWKREKACELTASEDDGGLGLSPKDAADMVDVTTGQAEKKIFSVGEMPEFLAKFIKGRE